MNSRRLGLPTRVLPINADSLPSRVTIWEVGARDGLQNESTVLPVETKLEFIQRLANAGLGVIEATSFVHPQWVPQLADADQLMAELLRNPNVIYPVLVPNERGLTRAFASGAEHIAVFVSATESFAQRNLNSGFIEQFDTIEPVVRSALTREVPIRGYISMCFGDPWEGSVPVAQVVETGLRLLELGCWQLSLGDTIGVATPGHVEAVLGGFIQAGVDPSMLAVHFHDTYGQALGNALTALYCGVSTIDASAGGLGGCPFAESATGNLATEDLVWMLDGIGIEHGVDLDALVATSLWMAEQLGRPSPSRVVRALA